MIRSIRGGVVARARWVVDREPPRADHTSGRKWGGAVMGIGKRTPTSERSLFAEEVVIDALDRVGLLMCHTKIVVYHEFGEL